MGSWREEYSDKLITAEDAAKIVKSGDQVVFTIGREAYSVGLAIAARKGELRNVSIFAPTPGYDFGWYDDGWQDSFQVTVVMPTGICQEAVDGRRVDVVPGVSISMYRPNWLMPADLVLTEVSPPDERGYCSFGQSLWNKKQQIRMGKVVVAEVNENLIRTYGDNYIHASEIDYFVDHEFSSAQPGSGSLAGRRLKEPEPYLKQISGYVSELIKDRDTIQMGVGRTTEPLVRMGMLDNRHDLGIHSEATPPGLIDLVRRGIINGRYKSINQDRVTVTSLGGGSKEEMSWANENPVFQLVNMDYLLDVKVISSNDNMVAINNILAIDLAGQSSSESLGEQRFSATGGQFAFVVGALSSKGGRSIAVLPSTAAGGRVSRIMPRLPEGTLATIPHGCADYVVTEYGIARLWNKPLRHRAKELISIAHPDFRSSLLEQARSLFG